ncbi:hypothetical protein OG936_28975 [Streptomyces sp. NBC_00846]|nr:hypothetical protein OG936_28975 [Streptomyces sp. NBC_00846]
MSSTSQPHGDVFLLGGELPVRRLGYGTAQLTGPGYFAGSCGGAPLTVVKQYIENQQRPV